MASHWPSADEMLQFTQGLAPLDAKADRVFIHLHRCVVPPNKDNEGPVLLDLQVADAEIVWGFLFFYSKHRPEKKQQVHSCIEALAKNSRWLDEFQRNETLKGQAGQLPEDLQAVLNIEQKLPEAELRRRTRRRIYFHRLIGDDVLKAKMKTSARASPGSILFFVVYLIIANVVVVSRCDTGTLAEMHRALLDIVEDSYFTLSPEPKFFADIKTRDDIVLWLVAIATRINLEQVENSNLPLTMNTYNRVVPESLVCLNQSSWRISMRRMALTSDYERTTTERFRQFYPEVWEADTISPGDKDPPAEDTSPYALTPTVDWNHTQAETNQKVLSGLSYEGAGGYVGIWTVSAVGIFFHLVSSDPKFAVIEHNPAVGLCGDCCVSKTLGGQAQPINLLDRQTASMTIEMIVYNANYQSLSNVAVSFGFDATGTLIKRKVDVRTILLDVWSPTMRYWEIAYIFGTSCYFFHFIYSAVKYYDRYLNDIWCFINFASILCSIISFTIWNIYEPRLQNSSTQTKNDFRQHDSINSLESLFSLYRRVSAIALLTIWLRSLQLLARLRARVRLLLQTLSMGAGKITAYMFYIIVFFSGFVAYAQSSFAYKTANFQTIPLTILTCVEMFFGKVEDNRDRGIRYSLWVVSFMIAFYIFSVQMFNAIINYSYNRVSEDMEPQFEKERNEQTRRELLRQAAGNTSRLTQLQKSLGAWLWKSHEKSGASVVDATAAKNKKEQAAIAPSAFETLDASIKEKVQGYLNRRKNRQVKYGPCAILLFVVFVGLYMLFLFFNISVDDSYRLQHAIDSAVRRQSIDVVSQSGQALSLQWDNISSIREERDWFGKVFIQVIFNTTTADGLACIKGWNCLVKLKEGSKNDKIVRITQRRRKNETNDGRRFANTPDEFAFTGGATSPNERLSTELVGRRVLEEFDLDFLFNVNWDGEEFCKVEQKGSTLGAGGKDNEGGIVCLLDNDYFTFERQVQAMIEADFFTPWSGETFIEFTTYNGKMNMLSYVTITFRTVLSGIVEPTMQVRSVKLFTTDGQLELAIVAQRILTCVAYMILCIILVYMLIKDLINEQERRKLQDDESKLTTAIEFFTHDLFRSLEAASILISTLNAVLFVLWIVEDSRLTDYYHPNSNFTVFLQYVQQLTNRAFVFKQAAAFNMLLIFVQPLRFLRTNSRISKLNQTLWDASVDIFWFVVMLLILVTAFVMFAMLSFGPKYYACRSFWDAAFICFKYIIGAFDYAPLDEADSLMAVLFFFPYLLLCYIIFNNIFFAIIDRFFITAEDKPWNWKRKFKPFLGRICRCVEWDDDHTLEQDPSKEGRMQAAVLSRRDRVHDTVQRVEKLKENGKEDATSLHPKRSKTLSDVCEVDSKMAEVLAWSKEEARKFMMLFEKYSKRKAEEKKSEENFVRDVMEELDKEVKELESEMKDAERHMRYHRDVHEQMALKDQETLARYILVLERKIQQVMDSNQKLRTKVEHLRQQSGAMQDLEPESPDEENPPGRSHLAPLQEHDQLRDDYSQTPSPAPARVDDGSSSTDSSSDSSPGGTRTLGSIASSRGGPPSRLGLGGPPGASGNNPVSARSAASASLQGQLAKHHR